jgi:hypothetical protein
MFAFFDYAVQAGQFGVVELENQLRPELIEQSSV